MIDSSSLSSGMVLMRWVSITPHNMIFNIEYIAVTLSPITHSRIGLAAGLCTSEPGQLGALVLVSFYTVSLVFHVTLSSMLLSFPFLGLTFHRLLTQDSRRSSPKR
ncbi:uncharacterized protein BDZ99DRAFT_142502 [Mytilinidion resinicola]|uniref:Uncharacterized protein n=1 Tax=Mytilinidion resinicola TaxID=574789 RepID=A0A6A6Y825_9PEZI|nr:uncharacterized protein BDZ99DRAFT_142502 [Mytilinidion resinicola]KAF2804759.1 hypothetical protein BDZ99DRAFT_142502 [Mytilinidion resinicola]